MTSYWPMLNLNRLDLNLDPFWKLLNENRYRALLSGHPAEHSHLPLFRNFTGEKLNINRRVALMTVTDVAKLLAQQNGEKE